MEERKRFIKGFLWGIGSTILVALIAFFAYQMYLFSNDEGMFAEKKEGDLDIANKQVLEKMEEIQDVINANYLNEIDPAQVEEYIYTGLVVGLGDPYANYFTQEEVRNLIDSSSGSYCGIGAVFSQNILTGVTTVTKVYEGFPAHEAGIKPGDVLYAVEGNPVTGQDLTQLVSNVKGEEGTWVRLTVIRAGESDYLEFDVERRAIEVPTIEYEMLEDQIGYVLISEFDKVTCEQFATALSDLSEQGMKGLVIDLRDNGGGVVSAVCELADQILPKGLIVYTEDKKGTKSGAYSDAERYFDKPLVVLVNENSASASEIFAGAVKDYGTGIIVGTKTYGKGIVQRRFTLSDGTAVKLTISKYFTPKGNDIHEVGIEPDVVVELHEELKTKPVITREEDNQLQKAIEVLKEQMVSCDVN